MSGSVFDRWRPYDSGREYLHSLKPGDVIGFEFHPWLVVEVAERPLDLWPEDDRQTWQEWLAEWRAAGRDVDDNPQHWTRRPMVLVVRRDDRPKGTPRHLGGSGMARVHTLPARYSVCHECGQLPPCRDEVLEREMDRASERMAELMEILPGVCHGCREPITRRQHSIRFEGENLLRPDLGADTAVFHTRRHRFDAAFRYDERWADAEPGRRRRLHCDGRQLTHADGSTECDQGDACPGAAVRHASGTWHHRGYATGCWCVDPTIPRPAMTGGLFDAEGHER